MFLESLLFLAKISKISKTLLPCFGDLVVSQASRMPQLRACSEGFRNSLAGQSPSRKKLRKFFKILVFNVSRDSVWRLVREWKVQSRGDSEIFVAYLATPSQVEFLVAKNT